MLNQFNILITTGFSGPLDYKQWLSCAMHAWPSRAMHAPNCSACYTLSSNSVKTSSKKSSKSCCASTSSTITENKQLIIPLICGERRRKKETERNGGRQWDRQKIEETAIEDRTGRDRKQESCIHKTWRKLQDWLTSHKFHILNSILKHLIHSHTLCIIQTHKLCYTDQITLYKKVIHTNLYL